MNIIATIIVSVFLIIQIYNTFELSKENGAGIMMFVALIILAMNCCIYYAIWR